MMMSSSVLKMLAGLILCLEFLLKIGVCLDLEKM